MHVAHLTLYDFRSYPALELPLGPGATAFVGRNGQGKTNLVEAIDYLSRLGSHRVATDAPLVRSGAERAVVRAAVVKDGRQAVLEVEIAPGHANRARVNRAQLPRARDLVGLLRTVVFSPEDLALVKGDPAERRRFLDGLLVLRTPRLAGSLADYDRVLRQRNTLLKSARAVSGSRREAMLSTLGVWDDQVVGLGSEIWAERLALVDALAPYLGKAYETVSRGASREDAEMTYRAAVGLDTPPRSSAATRPPAGGTPREPSAATRPPAGDTPREELAELLHAELVRRRADELDRGVTLVGPHRDELVLTLGRAEDPAGSRLPVRGYASHGESWSFALALRLASFHLLRAEGDDPILVLDDVFAELDTTRRDQLAGLVADAEQVLVTAAVGADVPAALAGTRFTVADGQVTRE